MGPGPVARAARRTQVSVGAEEYLRYDWQGRTIKHHRAQVREFFGFRETTAEDGERITSWLVEEVMPREQDPGALREAFFERRRSLRLQAPAEGRVERLLASVRNRFEEGFCASVFGALPGEAILRTDALLASDQDEATDELQGAPSSWDRHRSVVGWLKADPGRVGLESVLEEVEKLCWVREGGVPERLFLGDDLLPGAGRLIQKLRELDKRVVFLSNNPTRNPQMYAEKLTRPRLETPPSEIVNTVVTMTQWLRQNHLGATVFPIAEEPLKRSLAEAGINTS